MKNLSYGDLTPEFLKELYSLTTVEQIIEACKKRNLQVSEENVAKFLEQFEKAKKLSEEELENAAGAGKGYSGTKMLFSSLLKRGADCSSDWWEACDWDCWWDADYCCEQS